MTVWSIRKIKSPKESILCSGSPPHSVFLHCKSRYGDIYLAERVNLTVAPEPFIGDKMTKPHCAIATQVSSLLYVGYIEHIYQIGRALCFHHFDEKLWSCRHLSITFIYSTNGGKRYQTARPPLGNWIFCCHLIFSRFWQTYMIALKIGTCGRLLHTFKALSYKR